MLRMMGRLLVGLVVVPVAEVYPPPEQTSEHGLGGAGMFGWPVCWAAAAAGTPAARASAKAIVAVRWW